MEVASPLPFGHTAAGTKRQFPCTPVAFDTTNCSPFGESGDDFLHQRSFKRRRFAVDESMEGDTENSVNQTPFNNHQAFQKPFLSASSALSAQSFKRSRTETPQHELEKVVTSQANEIQSLKDDKQKVETSFNDFKSEHEKVLNENKILKRAVTIQQERQNQAASEIEAAHKYKFDAEERIKKLEQIILSLRYHLQTQQSNTRNDFMGFPHRPPDVY
ncbi:unnamed protein product [Cylindrotheca closterium]|uniref:Uncharacterized protein n=1 Tax=Cylindrotheca closterium TaxID=2856 RepID=A0AAD2FXK4_9STRA|nr:unnamed protein product [Cylindrotheca closterium]